MFWQSYLFWNRFIIILILAVICLVLAIYFRRKRLENKFKIEIENRGNIVSKYLLRLDNPRGLLSYQFSVNGGRLPMEVIAGLPGSSQIDASPAAGARGTNLGDQARSASNAVTQYAPSEISQPLTQVDSTLYEGQAEVGRIQYYMGKLGISLSGPKKGEAQAAPASHGEQWAVTGEVQPGKVLQVDLTVRTKHAVKTQKWPFRLVSRAEEDEQAPAVVFEGMGQAPTGFWTQPLYPELLILGVAFLLVVAMALIAIVTNL